MHVPYMIHSLESKSQEAKLSQKKKVYRTIVDYEILKKTLISSTLSGASICSCASDTEQQHQPVCLLLLSENIQGRSHQVHTGYTYFSLPLFSRN